MTQEEKQLLIKDLCARLPYGVMCHANKINLDGDLLFINKVYKIVALYNDKAIGKFDTCPIDDVKPYLRSMSSMTEEELKELNEKYGNIAYFFIQEPPYYYGLQAQHPDIGSIEISEFSKIYDWLNTHHLDYRGLIPMGLALEAPEGMYE